jgi:sortase (surface protein transpeptidase)
MNASDLVQAGSSRAARPALSRTPDPWAGKRGVSGAMCRRAVVLVVAAAMVAGCGGQSTDPPSAAPAPLAAPPASAEEPAPIPERVPAPDPVTEPRGAPVRVVVPAIAVDADLVELGLAADTSMEVPDFGLAGWYTEGPAPGRSGPSVVAAHVDSRAGPDVFYRLRELEAGDEVTVVYDSGDRAHFRVERRERTPKDELPVEDIWPVTAEPLLALLTCGGEFDRESRHYRDNIVVYTRPDQDMPVTLAAT